MDGCGAVVSVTNLPVTTGASAAFGSAEYEHPEDKRLLAAARAIPGLDLVIKKVSEHSFERAQYMHHIANSIRVSPRQHPRLYQVYREAVAILDLPEPELFISNEEGVNAYAAGNHQPIIVLHQDLIEKFSLKEVQFILGHELGHVKSGHTLYQTVLTLASGGAFSALGALPGIGPVIEQVAKKGSVYALQKWSRAAEFTADRAAALATNDLDLSLQVTMKLAGASNHDGDYSIEEFLRQADDYEEVSDSVAGWIGNYMNQAVLASHPYPVIRAKALKQWHGSSQFQALLSRPLLGRPSARVCPKCHAFVLLSAAHCRVCHSEVGTTSEAPPAYRHRCQKCAYPNNGKERYCANCGHHIVPRMYQRQGAVLPDTSRLPFNNVYFDRNFHAVESVLPGGLGQRISGSLLDDEMLVYECAVSQESAISLTDRFLRITCMPGHSAESRAFPHEFVAEIATSQVQDKSFIVVEGIDGSSARWEVSPARLPEVRWLSLYWRKLLEVTAPPLADDAQNVLPPVRVLEQLAEFGNKYSDANFKPVESTLPGKVGAQINQYLGSQSPLFYELLTDSGVGICITGQHLILSKAGFIAESYKALKIQAIPLEDVASLEIKNGSQRSLMIRRHSVSIPTGKPDIEQAYGEDHAPVSMQNVQQVEWLAKHWAAMIRERVGLAPVGTPPLGQTARTLPQAGTSDLLKRIEDLWKLKSAGALTEDEYQLAKQTIMKESIGNSR